MAENILKRGSETKLDEVSSKIQKLTLCDPKNDSNCDTESDFQHDPVLKRSSETKLDESSSKLQKCESNAESDVDNDIPNSLTYGASGLKSFLHGIVYQLQLLMLHAYRGSTTKYKDGKKIFNDFALATEMNAADKFDDVVFHYTSSETGVKSFRFLQAKHKRNAKEDKITTTDLIKSPDSQNSAFSIQKYFKSFLTIKERFPKVELPVFLLCTNTTLDIENLDRKGWKVCFEEMDLKDDHILYFEAIQASKLRFKNDDNTKKELIKLLGEDERASDEEFESLLDEFIEKFAFVTNYPDVDELNDLLKKEMKRDFRLPSPEHLTDSFEKTMCNWFKEKGGRYLRDQDIESFLSSI